MRCGRLWLVPRWVFGLVPRLVFGLILLLLAVSMAAPQAPAQDAPAQTAAPQAPAQTATAQAPAQTATAQAGSDRWGVPFAMDPRRGFLKRSPVDVSTLLDAPAGRHGFVTVRDGHLATGDGRRIRFWGVNVTDWSSGSRQIPAKEDAALWASTLARFGVNSVRLQFLDLRAPRGLVKAGGDTRSLDAEQTDREDFFLAALERRGIYIDFNLLVGRPFSGADGVRDAGLLREGAKGTSMFDARLIELQREYARELLGHVNPYTKLAYAEDPGVAMVEINNEDAIDVGYSAPSAFYEEELTGMYNRWLGEHRGRGQIAELRAMCGVGEGAQVPLLGRRGQAARAPRRRLYAEAEFYDDLQRGYFEGMEAYLKGTLGLKSLVIATADHNHAGSGYQTLLAERSMDVIDGHTYWEHPEFYVKKSPMVNDPTHSTVEELSRSAMEGKPYTVSEVNEAYPNDYGGEEIPILAAYGSLQDWDGIWWYTFEPKADPAWRPYVGDPFDLSLDPVKMPELAEGALMFLRGDVQKARVVRERSYTREQVFDAMLLPAAEGPYFTPGFPPDLPLQDEVRISSLNGPPTKAFGDAATVNPAVSDTGELAWYTSAERTGLVTVDTPRTQALIGFVRAQGRSVSHLSAAVENGFCTLLLSSMDGRPVAESGKLLLVAGGAVENTGQRWNSAGTDVTAWGGAPTVIEQVRGTVLLKGLKGARSVAAQAIDGAGQPLGAPVNGVARDGGLGGDGLGDWEIAVGAPVTTWYAITVRR